MAITTLQTATAGSISALVSVVKANIAASSYPQGGLRGVQATVGNKTEYFQPIGDMSVIQVTPGRTCEYAQAFTKA